MGNPGKSNAEKEFAKVHVLLAGQWWAPACRKLSPGLGVGAKGRSDEEGRYHGELCGPQEIQKMYAQINTQNSHSDTLWRLGGQDWTGVDTMQGTGGVRSQELGQAELLLVGK